MNHSWFYNLDDASQATGPVSLPDLLTLVATGVVQAQTLVGYQSDEFNPNIRWDQAQNIGEWFDGPNPSSQTRLAAFTASYHVALERLLEEKGRMSFPCHADAAEVVTMGRAADGYATFYLPAPPSEIAGGSIGRVLLL